MEKSFEEQPEYIAWKQYGADFDLWCSYSFAKPETYKTEAIRKYKNFYFYDVAREFNTHIKSLYGYDIQPQKRWARALPPLPEPIEGDAAPRSARNKIKKKNRFHVHSIDLFECAPPDIFAATQYMYQAWRRHGSPDIRIYEPEKSCIGYTLERHTSHEIYHITCPKIARSCKRGDCYWAKEISTRSRNDYQRQ